MSFHGIIFPCSSFVQPCGMRRKNNDLPRGKKDSKTWGRSGLIWCVYDHLDKVWCSLSTKLPFNLVEWKFPSCQVGEGHICPCGLYPDNCSSPNIDFFCFSGEVACLLFPVPENMLCSVHKALSRTALRITFELQHISYYAQGYFFTLSMAMLRETKQIKRKILSTLKMFHNNIPKSLVEGIN